MELLGMPYEWTDLLRRYCDNTLVAHLGASRTEIVPVYIGLKHGCPQSPLLYMLYTAGIECAIFKSGLGFHLWFTFDGSPEVSTLLGLVFADDLELLVEMAEELQGHLHIVAEHACTNMHSHETSRKHAERRLARSNSSNDLARENQYGAMAFERQRGLGQWVSPL